MARRLYCYVDESGLDSRSQVFVVAVIIAGEERDRLRELCEHAERESGKGRVKWSWAGRDRRMAYLRGLLADRLLQGKIGLQIHQRPGDSFSLTVATVARALTAMAGSDYKATILIDGLPPAQERAAGRRLHRMGIRTRKVRGIRDESDALIRLADAVCGLVRGAEEAQPELRSLLDRTLKSGGLRDLSVKT
ncbi:MAG: DUF3800 domain-containing protein [Chloroflexi bacterium]|nr:DUF3800 domain-containing protein [Chloroflexota bacterium]